ncbi:hypothetical protein [Micrococcus luteus]|uniref:hypothetical protein n=1 Tax=Micrococcus luteus TaxID=1270 RepID=UPI0019D26D70|nr:hypothetical protein [Micrococcus luteus]MBN6829322.1 hypothetical protein [Micrococcus luteus]
MAGPSRASSSRTGEPDWTAPVQPLPVAAVLVADEIPTDIRHNSKIDRARVADWAESVLAGGTAGAL